MQNEMDKANPDDETKRLLPILIHPSKTIGKVYKIIRIHIVSSKSRFAINDCK